MKLQTVLLGAAFLVLTLACNKKKEPIVDETVTEVEIEEEIVPDMHTAKTSLDYVANYVGVLPCADCEGIETSLEILDDLNYKMKTIYRGKKAPNTFEMTNTYTWAEDGNHIILNGIENAPTKYKVEEGSLVQLDMDGNLITGALADQYRLPKMLAVAKPEPVPTPTTRPAENNQVEAKPATRPAPSVLNSKWKIVELRGQAVKKSDTAKEDYFIEFRPDERVGVYAGCNNMNGTVSLSEGNRIKFNRLASTMMACPDMATEQLVSEVLNMVDNYTLSEDGKTLSLNKARMAPLMRLERM